MSIFINRILNLKTIKAVGFDMDYTLVRYQTETAERDTAKIILKKLVHEKNYPKEIQKLPFEFERAIRGLVLDKKRGNVLKLSLYGKVKLAYHGKTILDYKNQQLLYKNLVIDLNDKNFECIDTAFALSHAILYKYLVDFKDQTAHPNIPDYRTLSDDIKEVLDLAHRDDSIKSMVRENLDKYIIKEPKVVEALEQYKKYGKKLFLITNSDYHYTKTLMQYCFEPYLKDHKSWTELFDLSITFAAKPRFFTEESPYLKVDTKTGSMTNCDEPLEYGGVYQNGNAIKLQEDFDLQGEEILYLGDHIFGDIVSLKKSCNWRTALVIEEMEAEVQSQNKGADVSTKISELMVEKEKLEEELDELYAKEHVYGENVEKKTVSEMFSKIQTIDKTISQHLKEYQNHFNPFWGEVFRAGYEESRFAGQVEKYACIYMSKASDLFDVSPRKYFRPRKRILPHE